MNDAAMPCCAELEFHPVASLFPLMDDWDLQALREDIAANGLREPIWLHEGKIIDGRNRYRACMEAGVDPVFREWDEDGDLATFVVSLNLHRRHLNTTQRSAIAAELVLLRPASPGRHKKMAQICANPSCDQEITHSQAADRLNVSERNVDLAVSVIKNGVPDLVRVMKGGDVSVSSAAVIAGLPAEKQAELVAEGPRAVKAGAAAIRAARERSEGSRLIDADEGRREEFDRTVNRVRAFAASVAEIEKLDVESFRWSPSQKRALARSLTCIRENLDHAIAYLRGGRP